MIIAKVRNAIREAVTRLPELMEQGQELIVGPTIPPQFTFEMNANGQLIVRHGHTPTPIIEAPQWRRTVVRPSR
jgi:hypothetical protein